VKVFKDEQEVDGRSIIGLLTLAVECGSSIRIIIEGTDELDVLRDVTNLIENKFYEE
jgi:phosphotransferase system HPr (HPr) family protein